MHILPAFSRALGALIDAGLAPQLALETLANNPNDPAVAGLARRVRTEVDSGLSLSAALARHPDAFDPLSIGLVRAGEAGGAPQNALGLLAAYLDRVGDTRRRVTAVFRDPAVVVGIALAVMALLMVVVMPQFRAIYDSMNVELPAVTRMVLELSAFVEAYWLWLAPAALAARWFSGRVWRSRAGGRVMARVGGRLPLVGPLMRALGLARFTRALGTALSAGVPVLDALDLAASAARCPIYRAATSAALPLVREGESLAGALHGQGLLPAGVPEMLAEAEDRGVLAPLLLRLAGIEDGEVDRGLRTLSAVLEPAVIVLLGAMIVSLVLAVFIPLSRCCLINNVG